jgi:hypothetical protein
MAGLDIGARQQVPVIDRTGGPTFGETLTRAINEVSDAQDASADLAGMFMRGENVELPQVMAASEEAGHLARDARRGPQQGDRGVPDADQHPELRGRREAGSARGGTWDTGRDAPRSIRAHPAPVPPSRFPSFPLPALRRKKAPCPARQKLPDGNFGR